MGKTKVTGINKYFGDKAIKKEKEVTTVKVR